MVLAVPVAAALRGRTALLTLAAEVALVKTEVGAISPLGVVLAVLAAAAAAEHGLITAADARVAQSVPLHLERQTEVVVVAGQFTALGLVKVVLAS
jgi:hypothetical protein